MPGSKTKTGATPKTKAARTSTGMPKPKTGSKPKPTLMPAKAGEPVLLSGGNPQIAKGYGDGPIHAYVVAMPGWKRAVGERLDALITKNVPGVRKAVKWNSPFYGAPKDDGTWFMSFHCFAKYVKVAFFRGAQLRSPPTITSKHQDVRYFHIHEGDEFDKAQFAAWVREAAALPGEKM